MSEALPIPRAVEGHYADWHWANVSRWPGAFDTYRLEAPSGVRRFQRDLSAPMDEWQLRHNRS